jgi:hypothetical protein
LAFQTQWVKAFFDTETKPFLFLSIFSSWKSKKVNNFTQVQQLKSVTWQKKL